MFTLKKKLFIGIFVVICFIICFIAYFLLFGNDEDDTVFINDSDYLYDLAIEYLRENDYDLHQQDEDYQMFVSYDGFGISKENEYKYAYMEIASQSYYVKDGELFTSSGRVLDYKFTFKDDKVVKYEVPTDGNAWEKSVRKLFPKKISSKILKYDFSKLVEDIDAQAEEHYAYLNSEENSEN